MAAEYCCLEKKYFIGGRPRQEILKIEIYTWNKKTNYSLIFIRSPSELPKIIKKYLFLQKLWAFECNTPFSP